MNLMRLSRDFLMRTNRHTLCKLIPRGNTIKRRASEKPDDVLHYDNDVFARADTLERRDTAIQSGLVGCIIGG